MTPATISQAMRGFEWTKSLWALTLMIWIALFSYKAYDRLCSQTEEEAPPPSAPSEALPEETQVKTPGPAALPSFDPNWKGYSYSKIKAPRNKNRFDEKKN